MKKALITFLIMLLCTSLFANLASAMSAVINIPEKYSEVNAGEKVYFETDIKWPENTERKDLKIEYSIKDQNGEEIAYLKVLKAVETQASFMDSISIPESTKAGTYKIFLSIKDYGDLNQEVAASFKISKTADSYSFYFLVILGVVGLIAIIVVIELFILIRKQG